MLIRRLIAAYLALAVDPPDPPDPAAGGGAEDPPDGSNLEDLDLDGDDPPDDPDGRGAGGNDDDPDAVREQLRTQTARAEKAEREAREAADRAAAAERARQAPPPAQNDEQRLFEAEEAKLRDAATSEMERWQINSNRTLRATQRESAQALWHSREMADKAEYSRLCTEKPLAKKYAQRVEEKLAEMRKGGFNIERKLVLKMIIGDDIVEGKVKTGKKAASADRGDPPPPRNQVERGRQPVTRSDVRGRAAPSEHEKRKARLENKII